MSRLSAWWAQWPDSTVEKLYAWLPFVVFGLLAAVFYWPYLHWFPQGIHAWGQSDRLALAYGFYDHGFNFLLPRTFTLRSIDAVVGVEFPLQAYIVSLLGLVVGRSSISITFRLLDIAMLVVGCSYLFKLVFESTRSAAAAFVPGAFLFSAPIFAYYAGNYLPDSFAVSLLFVSFYYLHRFYYSSRRTSDFVLGFMLAVLATLVKLSIFLYLGAICGVIFTVSWLQPFFLSLRQKLLFLGMMAVSFSAIGTWIFYMRWLNEKYESWLFLASVNPLKDKAQSDWVIKNVQEYVVDYFLTPSAYWVVYISLAIVVVYAFLRWKNFGRYAPYLLLLLVLLLSAVPYYILMGPQFGTHDYYTIAPIIPWLVLVILGAVLAVVRVAGNRWWTQLFSAGLVCLLVYDGYTHYQLRMHNNQGPNFKHGWLVDGSTWLDRAGVPATARIMVIGRDDTPNLALVHFQRTGLVVSDSASYLTSGTALGTMAGYQLKYMVIHAGVFRKFQEINPAFLEPFKTIAADDKRVLLVPREPLKGW